MKALATVLRSKGDDWKARARRLVINYDDAFPSLRMCKHFIRECHEEFSDVPLHVFSRFMSSELKRWREQ